MQLYFVDKSGNIRFLKNRRTLPKLGLMISKLANGFRYMII